MNADLAHRLQTFSEAAKNLKGWSFEYKPESLSGPVPWNYEEMASNLLNHGDVVLDLGTGGGEVFSRIVEGKDCVAYASEEWHVNAPVARDHLYSKANVIRASSSQLPFTNQSFDLVLARHEAIQPEEIERVLKSEGTFLTQQVIPDFMHELKDTFPNMTAYPNHYFEYQEGFSKLGLNVERAEEYRYQIRFNNLGHLVYQLVATPWTVPGFDVDSHLGELSMLDAYMRSGGELLFTAGYYLIKVTKDG